MAIDTTAKLSIIIAVLQEDKPTPSTFKVKRFHHLKNQGDCAESPHFYTSINGYCMSIRVYPAGYGKHVAVEVWSYDGDYDADLSWPLKADVTVALLNQLEDKNHFSIRQLPSILLTVNMKSVLPSSLNYSKLEHNPVKKTQYLKDDTLYFKVTVNLNNGWLKCTNV